MAVGHIFVGIAGGGAEAFGVGRPVDSEQPAAHEYLEPRCLFRIEDFFKDAAHENLVEQRQLLGVGEAAYALGALDIKCELRQQRLAGGVGGGVVARKQEFSQLHFGRQRHIVGHTAHFLHILVALALHNGVVDLALALEIGINGAPPLFRSGSYVVHCGVGETFAGKELPCHVYQFFAGFQYHLAEHL